MNPRRHRVEVTTDAAGAAEAYFPQASGEVIAVRYLKDGASPYADTVDFTITLERSGVGLWTESNVAASKGVSPMQPAHDQAGAAVTYDGVNEIYRPIYCAEDRVKVVLAQGSDTKQGTFEVEYA